MTRQTTRQILAIGSLLGFMGLTAAIIYLVAIGTIQSGIELIFGTWSTLIGYALAFYFKQDADEVETPETLNETQRDINGRTDRDPEP